MSRRSRPRFDPRLIAWKDSLGLALASGEPIVAHEAPDGLHICVGGRTFGVLGRDEFVDALYGPMWDAMAAALAPDGVH